MLIMDVVIDCADPERLAPFWAAATGYTQTWTNGEFLILAPDAPGRPQLLLQRVPEAKIGKNRVHVDLGALDAEAEIQRLVELGASRGEAFDIGIARWTVMADPEGNEFCIAALPAADQP